MMLLSHCAASLLGRSESGVDVEMLLRIESRYRRARGESESRRFSCCELDLQVIQLVCGLSSLVPVSCRAARGPWHLARTGDPVTLLSFPHGDHHLPRESLGSGKGPSVGIDLCSMTKGRWEDTHRTAGGAGGSQ
jgi:hypothetical protein